MHTSETLKNLSDFPLIPIGLELNPRGKGTVRSPGDMFLVWKTIEYFAPKSLLEIGFYGGQSMGLYIESSKLERILNEYRFDPVIKEEARKLIDNMIEKSISKYNKYVKTKFINNAL